VTYPAAQDRNQKLPKGRLDKGKADCPQDNEANTAGLEMYRAVSLNRRDSDPAATWQVATAINNGFRSP